LLIQISELGLGIPITLILDNACYQKCKIVNELALVHSYSYLIIY